jgi:hypothetical protein
MAFVARLEKRLSMRRTVLFARSAEWTFLLGL